MISRSNTTKHTQHVTTSLAMNDYQCTESLNVLLNKKPSFLMGHRGARGEVFENSLAGFIHLQQLAHKFSDKLIGVEFDVQLTEDGRLAVFHDEDLLRLFNLQSRIEQLPLKRVQSLTIGNYQVPTLEQVAPFLKSYQHIELEIKTHDRTNYSKLINALNTALNKPEFEHLPITLTSFDIKLHELIQAHPCLSTFKRGLLVELHHSILSNNLVNTSHLHDNTCNLNLNQNQDHTNTKLDITDYRSFSLNTLTSTNQALSQAPNIAMRLGCQGIGLYYAFYNQPIIELCQRYGLSTTAWTVNEVAEAKRLVNLGVRYLITDYPAKLLSS